MYEYVMAPEQDVVISSRVRLSRNYEDLPFSPKLNQGYAEEVIERTTEAVFSTENGAAFTFLRMADLEEDARSRCSHHWARSIGWQWSATRHRILLPVSSTGSRASAT